MYSFRLWTGSLIFAIGIAFWMWFLRNASRKIVADQSRLYRTYHKGFQVIWNCAWVAGGLWVYPIPGTIPLLALIVGAFSGIYISNTGQENNRSRLELFKKRKY